MSLPARQRRAGHQSAPSGGDDPNVGACQTLTVGRFLHRRHRNRQDFGSSTDSYNEAADDDEVLVFWTNHMRPAAATVAAV